MPTPLTHTEISEIIADSSRTIGGLSDQLNAVAAAADLLVSVLMSGGTVLTAGNGGSAAEALHFSEELVGRYRGDRRSLPAVSLVADSTALTCIGNDYGYDAVFSRQVEGLCKPGDLLILFSTSGNAMNLSNALDAAQAAGGRVLTFLGRDGGRIAGAADVEVIVKHDDTARIQEAHQVLLHLMLESVERAFPPEAV